MIWREPKSHSDNCYFCAINLTGINKKKCKSFIYPNLPSALRPVANCDEIPISAFKELPDAPNENLDVSFEEQDHLDDNDFVPKSTEPILFNQEELSDLIRELNISKESSELLASRLNDRNLLQQGTKVTFYIKRDDEFLRFFRNYQILFFVLIFQVKYDAIKTILQHIKYEHHYWVICVDSKMLNFLLGQQSGHTKFPCFLCYWDSRDKANQWKIKNWSVREQLKVGDKNVIRDQVAPREKNHISSFTHYSRTSETVC